MNRENIYRGKKVYDGQWIEGNLFVPDKLVGGIYICPATSYFNFHPDLDGEESITDEMLKKSSASGISLGHFHEVIPNTIGQFMSIYDDTKFHDLSVSEQHAFLNGYDPTNSTKKNNFSNWKGRRIFEGDVARVEIKRMFYEDSTELITVEFENGLCNASKRLIELQEEDCAEDVGASVESIIVIGNIHDNQHFYLIK